MSAKSSAIWEKLRKGRSIALLNPRSPRQCLEAYELLDPLGIVLEIAFRSDHALGGMEAVLTEHPDALFLAGTVLTRGQAEAALGVGAAGLVSPDFLPMVLEACVAEDVMYIPGGLADCGKQLALKAELYGCAPEELRRDRPWQWVHKVFPATGDEAGVARLTAAWRSVFPGISFVYTGGVTPENVDRLSRSDPQGIFCGSSLTRHLEDPDRARRDALTWLGAVRGERGPTGERGARPEASPGAVVTFGEPLLRLSPPGGTPLRSATVFEATHGGAEANVAAALAQWGVPSRYVTALPDHELADGVLDRLRQLGVDTSAVLRREGRLGIYFLEHGVAGEPPRVQYDRSGSAVAGLAPGEVDWDAVLSGAAWLHLTGITPALGPDADAVVREAARAGRLQGATVSFDLNYRPGLWNVERARTVLSPLVAEVDVLVGNRGQVAAVLDEDASGDFAPALMERFGLRLVALTSRKAWGRSATTWQGSLHDGKRACTAGPYTVDAAEGVGSGDAFAAGLIYGLLKGMEPQEALEFGAAAACLKLTMPGDILVASALEVREMAARRAQEGTHR